MYKVLVVDNDTTCLLVLRTCLEKWNYQVTTTTHAQEALSMLRNTFYDLVLTDVHMPDINGLQLQEHIIKEFNLPVILMSADNSEELMCMGVKNGAQGFLVKPIAAEEVRDIWQLSEWWKRKPNNNTAPVRQTNTENNADDNKTGRKNNRLNWTSDLHNRFVEAIIVIGYQRAVPTNIVQVMNVEGLTIRHVASHLQKFQKFLQGVLEGRKNIEISRWTDLTYHSSFVSGNPTLVLIDQLRQEQRKGKLATKNPLRQPKPEYMNMYVGAPNGSLSPSYPKLPPYTKAEGSSNTSMHAGLTQNNNAYSSANVASRGLGSATLWNADILNMGGTVGSSTSSIHNESYRTNQVGDYSQNTVAQEQNYSNMGGTLWNADNANMGGAVGSSTSSVHNLSYWTNQVGDYCQNTVAQGQHHSFNGGQVGGANNNMFPSANNVAPSSMAPLRENFYSQQSINVGMQDMNNFFYTNNFDTDQETQLGNNFGDPSIESIFNANHFANTSAMTAQQVGGQVMTDGSGFNNNGFNSTDPNQAGTTGKYYWPDTEINEDGDTDYDH